jgi:hypothetical protein
MRKPRPITAVLVKTVGSAEVLDSLTVEGKQGRKAWAGFKQLVWTNGSTAMGLRRATTVRELSDDLIKKRI